MGTVAVKVVDAVRLGGAGALRLPPPVPLSSRGWPVRGVEEGDGGGAGMWQFGQRPAC
jgi:hypothetical protein